MATYHSTCLNAVGDLRDPANLPRPDSNAAATHLLRQLREYWHAQKVFLVAESYEAGAPLLAELGTVGAAPVGVICRVSSAADHLASVPLWRADSHVHEVDVWAFGCWLTNPPAGLISWLDDQDPTATAIVVGNTNTRTSELATRPVYGWRRESWVNAEDKTHVDALLDQLGLPHPPGTVLSVADVDADSAFNAHGRRGAVVLSLDVTTGVRGGGSGVRYADSARALANTLEWARGQALRCRISQFVPGTPCSVIGLCLPEERLVFAPLEVLTCLDEQGTLLFAGTSSYWQPKPPEVAELNTACDLVGAYLTSELAFQGFFSVDGVLAQERFLVTEINSRFSSGLDLSQFPPGFPILLAAKALQEQTPPLSSAAITRICNEAAERMRRAPSADLWSLRAAEPDCVLTIAPDDGDQGALSVQAVGQPGADVKPLARCTTATRVIGPAVADAVSQVTRRTIVSFAAPCPTSAVGSP